MEAFRSVAVAGAGQLGRLIVQELLAAGFEVTVLTRSASGLKDIPSNAQVEEVDYTSVDSITAALDKHEVEVLIASLAMNAIMPVQPQLISAAAASKSVRRFVPSDYSGTTQLPTSNDIPLLEPMLDLKALVEQKAAEGCFDYTLFAPGGFAWMFIETLLDWDTQTAVIYDGGIKPVSMSSLETIAKGVAAALRDPGKYRNAVVRLHDGTITQRRCLEIARETRPDIEWKVIELDARQTIRQGLEALANGASFGNMAVTRLLAANVLAEGNYFGWTDEDDQSRALGLDVLGQHGLEALVEKRARGESLQ